MRYLGIDYGAKRIGIAISDAGGGFAFPRETIPNDHAATSRLARLVAEEGVGAIVLGDARAINGAANPVTAAVEAFASALKAQLEIPVVLSSEAWSSAEAARYAPKGKEHDDAAAAAVILQRYLDTNPPSGAI